MDMLVVAAAAGAGCLAKYWQDVFGERGIRPAASGDAFAQSGGNSGTNGSGFSSSTNEGYSQKRVINSEESSLLSRRTHRRFADSSGKPESLASLDVHQHVGTLTLFPDLEKQVDYRNRDGGGDSGDHVSKELASTSGSDLEPLMIRMSREGYDSSYLSGAQSMDGDGCEELNDGSNNALDKSSRYSPDLDETENVLSNDFSPRISDGRYRFCRNRSILQRRWSHGYSMKPMTALESCLSAQLYREPVEMEEYVFSSPRSPSARILLPFVVNKDDQIFSCTAEDQQRRRVSSGLCASRLGYGSVLLDHGHRLTGMPPLPAAGLKDSQRKEKQQMKKAIHREVNASGSIDAVLLFCFGIGVGVMSTILSSKHEVNRLNELLKQTEILVQDLQEELEMKDSLTVKELASESCTSPERMSRKSSIKKATKSSTSKELDEYCDHNEHKPDMVKWPVDSESMSKIEAELEAELERLELNMSGFGHKRRLSGLSELDPDCMVDIVHGELRADVVEGGRGSESDLDASSSSSTPMHRSDYAVSPRELCLRLHQVNQSRLEQRIAELETALQYSQKRVDAVENHERSLQLQAGFSSNDISPTLFESPTMCTCQTRVQLDFPASGTRSVTDEENHNGSTQPLHLNLSGDALDAYNDVFDEFIKMAESERDGTQTKDAILQDEPNPNGLTDPYKGGPDVVEENDEQVSRMLIKHLLENKKGKLVAREARKMLQSFEDMSSE